MAFTKENEKVLHSHIFFNWAHFLKFSYGENWHVPKQASSPSHTKGSLAMEKHTASCPLGEFRTMLSTPSGCGVG